MCRIETPGERSTRTQVTSVRPLKGSMRASANLIPTRTPCTAQLFPQRLVTCGCPIDRISKHPGEPSVRISRRKELEDGLDHSLMAVTTEIEMLSQESVQPMLPVRDLGVAAGFYEKTLRLTPVDVRPGTLSRNTSPTMSDAGRPEDPREWPSVPAGNTPVARRRPGRRWRRKG